jgi:hypothetical protein
VLTNNHVIAGATTISAIDVGNGRTYKTSVVGYDRSHDIAVLQLTGPARLKAATFGESATLAVGESIVAVGNAGGVGGPPRAAAGTLVALDQHVGATDESGAISERLSGLIKVDVDVQPGDSGGPLINSSGQVVGIDTAASVESSFHSPRGQAYAIATDQALAIAAQIEGGRPSASVHVGPTGFLGVELSSVASRTAVLGVSLGSPAAAVGLAPGDVITSWPLMPSTPRPHSSRCSIGVARGVGYTSPVGPHVHHPSTCAAAHLAAQGALADRKPTPGPRSQGVPRDGSPAGGVLYSTVTIVRGSIPQAPRWACASTSER